MNFKKGFKKFIFNTVVVKPYGSLLIIAILIVVAYLAVNNVEVGVYFKAQGVFTDEINDSNDIHIQVILNKSDSNSIESEEKIIWFLEEEGKRYSGSIINIEDSTDSGRVVYEIKPDNLDIDDTLILYSIANNEQVYVNFYMGTEKVLKRILK